MVTNAHRRTALLVGAVAVLAIAWLWQVDRQTDAPGSSPHAGIGNPDASDSERLAALENRIKMMQDQIDMLAANSLQRRPYARTGVRLDEESEAAVADPVAAERERDQRFAEMDSKFRSEPVDPRWAPGAEARLQTLGNTDAIRSIEAAGPISQDVDCRSRNCRLRFTFAEEGDAIDWATAYVTSVGSTLGRSQYAIQRRRDGSADVIIFGERK